MIHLHHILDLTCIRDDCGTCLIDLKRMPGSRALRDLSLAKPSHAPLVALGPPVPPSLHRISAVARILPHANQSEGSPCADSKAEITLTVIQSTNVVKGHVHIHPERIGISCSC